jgi:hypothetical protein
MSAAAIRAFGIITFIVDAFIVLAFNRRRFLDGPLPLRAFIAMAVYIFAVTLVGLGLLLLRKWAAIIFALAVVVFPTWMTIELIGEAPLGFYLMMLAAGIVLILPIIVILRSWRLLSWRGKWLL